MIYSDEDDKDKMVGRKVMRSESRLFDIIIIIIY